MLTVEQERQVKAVAFAPCKMLALDTGVLGAVLDSWTEAPDGVWWRRTVIDDLTGETTNFPAERVTPESAAIAQQARLTVGFRWVEPRR